MALRVVPIAPPSRTLQFLRQIVSSYEADASAFFVSQLPGLSSWESAWRELVYCILAGTQVKAEIAHRAFDTLMSFPEGLPSYSEIKQKPRVYRPRLGSALTDAGYRYPKSKAATIVHAARVFPEIVELYDEVFLLDPVEVRDLLVNRVEGIGLKIASHWVRNLGFPLPVIDVHVRRVLTWQGLLDPAFAKDQVSPRGYRLAESLLLNLAVAIAIPPAVLEYALWRYGRENGSLKLAFG